MTIKRWAALASAGALVAAGAVIALAVPASAHTGDLDVSATCNTTTGEYDLTATLTVSQTGEDGSTMWGVGTNDGHFTGTPTSANGLDKGPVSSHGSQTVTLGAFSIPGTTKGLGPWVYAYTTWTPDNYTKGSDGQLTQALAGDCVIPTPQDATASVSIQTQAGCGVAQHDTFAVENAQLISVGNDEHSLHAATELDQTPGTHVARFQALKGHLFSKGETAINVTYTIAAASTPESTNPSPGAGQCYVPPTIQQCTQNAGVTVTDFPAGWDVSDTRSAGHYNLLTDGLRIWTDDASNQAKVAGYFPTDFALADAGTQSIADSISYDATTGITPGLQLVLDANGDGTADGILVGEAVYGNDWWSNAVSGPEHGGGYGSTDHGTLQQWLAEYPNAKVLAIGFSLGSGVHASGVLHSITLGCTTYTFAAQKPPQPESIVTTKTTPSTQCTPQGGSGTETDTTVTTTTAYVYDADTNTWVKGEPTSKTTVSTKPVDATVCPAKVVTPPKSTPTVKTVEPAADSTVLAHTGSDAIPGIAIGVGALSIGLAAWALALVRRRTRKHHVE
jgi:hypothetical protein